MEVALTAPVCLAIDRSDERRLSRYSSRPARGDDAGVTTPVRVVARGSLHGRRSGFHSPRRTVGQSCIAELEQADLTSPGRSPHRRERRVRLARRSCAHRPGRGCPVTRTTHDLVSVRYGRSPAELIAEQPAPPSSSRGDKTRPRARSVPGGLLFLGARPPNDKACSKADLYLARVFLGPQTDLGARRARFRMRPGFF